MGFSDLLNVGDEKESVRRGSGAVSRERVGPAGGGGTREWSESTARAQTRSVIGGISLGISP